MKRIILMLTVAAMMVVAMSVTAAPAFAFGHDDGCTKDGSTVTCPGKNKNWTQTQKGSTNSSHPERNRNKGGNFPAGQQD